MKYSKAEVHCKTHGLPELRCEDSQQTSFSGFILLQALFVHLGLKERLRRCFSDLTVSPIFGHATLVLCLVLHLMLGYRRLRDIRHYRMTPGHEDARPAPSAGCRHALSGIGEGGCRECTAPKNLSNSISSCRMATAMGSRSPKSLSARKALRRGFADRQI
jgi:hypothetical protein